MAGAHGLRFGLWYALRNPPQWRVDDVALYQAHLRQIAWAETIGYDDVWLTEHHFCEDGHAPSILPLAAAVAATTTRIRIGTSVLLLPLHHAVRVAEDAATIDILSAGRFELGVGVGYRPQEFAGLGLSPHDRAGLTAGPSRPAIRSRRWTSTWPCSQPRSCPSCADRMPLAPHRTTGHIHIRN